MWPLVPGVPLPPHVERLSHPLVVGLFATPERIVQIRQNRLLGLKAHRDGRSIYRSSGSGRGNCRLASALRQAQLAVDRRHPAFDRRKPPRRCWRISASGVGNKAS